MENTIKLSINELEEFLNRAFAKLREKKNNDELVLKKDFYWNITNKELYNPYKKPKELTIGQLSEDIDMLNESKQREIIAYEFVKLSSIIRYIGENENW